MMLESKVTFIYNNEVVKIRFDIDSTDKAANEMMQEYVNFLRAIGYVLDGEEYDFIQRVLYSVVCDLLQTLPPQKKLHGEILE